MQEEVTISLLNPAQSYEPGSPAPARGPGVLDPPKISDKSTGSSSGYHILAATSHPVANSIVEATLRTRNANEDEIGLMEQVAGRDDVFELYWDVPESVPEGLATLSVRLYQQQAEGLTEIAHHSVEVDVQHLTSGAPIDEAVELTWPTNDGPLGFFKPRGGGWRTAIDGVTSGGALAVRVFYSTTPLGQVPKFKRCPQVLGPPSSTPTLPELPFGFPTGTLPKPFRTTCALEIRETPSDVTAIAAVTIGGDEPGIAAIGSQDAADVSVIQSYAQDPDSMTIDIAGVPPFSPTSEQPTGLRRKPQTGCIQLDATVLDHWIRPVVGANVDLHASGPTDRLGFVTTVHRAPDEGSHRSEAALDCTGKASGVQGRHVVVGDLDVMHAETRIGTDGNGRARFEVFSFESGITKVTAWIDDARLENERHTRPPNTDTLEVGKPAAFVQLQWLPAPILITVNPPGDTAAPGECKPYVFKVRSGTTAVPGINVDVHASGPADDLSFCDLPGTSERRGPDADPSLPAPPHQHGEDRQASHPGTVNAQTGQTGPRTIHTEGETDRFGNFVVGVTATSAGDSIVTAWSDGERGADNDVQGGNEPAVTGTIAWGTGEPRISFLNPSAYGGSTQGSGTGTQLPDSGGKVTLLARVDSAVSVDGVEFLLSSDGKKTFKELGPATPIDGTDVWSLPWPITLVDGNYALRARIAGTAVTADVDVKVGAGDQAPLVPNPPYETLRLTRLVPGALLGFRGDLTTVEGVASAGAEGVDIFYTKAASKDTPKAADWIFCGYVDLDGLGSASQSFAGSCRLAGGDQAAQVTGVAAITYDCTVPGCDAHPTPASVTPGVPPRAREPGQKDSGDAVRIFGFEAHPLLAIEPAEAEGPVGSCVAFEVVLRDQTGQPMGGENIDLHVPDQGGAVALCDPETGSGWRLPEGGEHSYEPAFPDLPSAAFHQHETDGSRTYHVEATTPPSGTLMFGVTSSRVGDASALVWLDRNDDDIQGPEDLAVATIIHFRRLGRPR